MGNCSCYPENIDGEGVTFRPDGPECSGIVVEESGGVIRRQSGDRDSNPSVQRLSAKSSAALHRYRGAHANEKGGSTAPSKLDSSQNATPLLDVKAATSDSTTPSTNTGSLSDSARPSSRDLIEPPGQEEESNLVEKVVTFENGAVYSGQWLGNKRCGRGTQEWADGARYEGEWQDDKACGHGRFIHIDGDLYVGQWKGDKANGHGIYHHADGSRYEGEWLDDNQHGLGLEEWPDGAKYEGQYAGGKKEGRGRFQWSDSSVYEGEFSNNDIDGLGVYVWNDKRKYEGQWKANRMDGFGRFTWADGRYYEGRYIKDQKEGKSIFCWPDGRSFIGSWKGGKQHGKGVYVTARGERKVGEWEEGKRLRWSKDPAFNADVLLESEVILADVRGSAAALNLPLPLPQNCSINKDERNHVSPPASD